MQSTAATKTTTTTKLTSNPNPSTKGQTVTFTATVAGQNGGTPTGTVVFQNGLHTKMATKTLSAGSARLAISTLPTGTLRIEAVYSGDANFAGNTSNVVKQVVDP
jgi:hypothetical protein